MGCSELDYNSSTYNFISNNANTWQYKYAEILRNYIDIDLTGTMEDSWNFALHDIDRDGVPELFIIMEYSTLHVGYRYIYTFIDGIVKQLEFNFIGATDGGILIPPNNSPFIIFFYAAGSGGRYHRIFMYEDRLEIYAEGFFHLSPEGFEKMYNNPNEFNLEDYKWYVLTVNGNPATIEEFENLFGSLNGIQRLDRFRITEENIENYIFFE